MDEVHRTSKRFGYRPYYLFNGPSHSDPLRARKSDEQVALALSTFHMELQRLLNAKDTTIAKISEVIDGPHGALLIETTLDERLVDETVKQVLRRLDLFATKFG